MTAWIMEYASDMEGDAAAKKKMQEMAPHCLVEKYLLVRFLYDFRHELAAGDEEATEKIFGARNAMGYLRVSRLRSARAGLLDSLRKEIPCFLFIQDQIFPREDLGDETLVVDCFTYFGHEDRMVREVLQELCAAGAVARREVGGIVRYILAEDVGPVWQETREAVMRFGRD